MIAPIRVVVVEDNRDNQTSSDEMQHSIYREHDMILILSPEQFERYKILLMDDQVWISHLMHDGSDFQTAFLQTTEVKE